jgi:hypothetical protein
VAFILTKTFTPLRCIAAETFVGLKPSSLRYGFIYTKFN